MLIFLLLTFTAFIAFIAPIIQIILASLFQLTALAILIGLAIFISFNFYFCLYLLGISVCLFSIRIPRSINLMSYTTILNLFASYPNPYV